MHTTVNSNTFLTSRNSRAWHDHIRLLGPKFDCSRVAETSNWWANKLNLHLNILAPLKDRIAQVEKRLKEYVELCSEPIKYCDAEECIEYYDNEYALTFLHEDFAENLLERCNYGSQLPCFLYLCRHIERSELIKNLVEKYGGDYWNFGGIKVSEELLVEIRFKEHVDFELDPLIKINASNHIGVDVTEESLPQMNSKT